MNAGRLSCVPCANSLAKFDGHWIARSKKGVVALAYTPQTEPDHELREAELAAAVMQYLTEHPKAMDTLDGIAEWWVMRQQVRVDVDMLAKVLRKLTEKGVLEQIGSGEYTSYHLKT